MYFYDTCALLDLQEQAFAKEFLISSVTLRELEDIKSSGKKDEQTKAKARQVVRLLDKNWNNVIVVGTSGTQGEIFLRNKSLPLTNDTTIIADCYCYQKKYQLEDIMFVTHDLCCRAFAQLAGLTVSEYDYEGEDCYLGWRSALVNDEQMSALHSDPTGNPYGLLTNEYLRVLNTDGELKDVRKWNGEKFVDLYSKGIKSVTMGEKLKPRDEYQHMAIDSIMSNTLTILSGKAGSGKTLIALASIFTMIEKGIYDRVVIMTNPCKVRGTADMGFYSGDSQKKIMQNSLGNVLITKFGDRFVVDNLISQNKLKIMSIADCRGMEIKDNEILYITESQNLSVDMIKLVLERASQGCKVVLDGDFDAQVDSWAYEGKRNGMKRAVEKFKGNPLFGYVELPNVWRSKLAELAQSL